MSSTIEGGCTRPARRRRRAHALPRRKTVRWSSAEVDGLLEGVREHGVGKWAAILRSSACFNAVRTSVDLKDKWRNLAAHVRALALQPKDATKLRRPMRSAPSDHLPRPLPPPLYKPEPHVQAPPSVSTPTTASYAPPPPLHPAPPPLAYPAPRHYAPRVLAPLPVPLAPAPHHDPTDGGPAVSSAAVVAAAAHAPPPPHLPMYGNHELSSYFGDFATLKHPTAQPAPSEPLVRTLPPPAAHTPHDAVPTAAAAAAAASEAPPPTALNFDPFPVGDLE